MGIELDYQLPEFRPSEAGNVSAEVPDRSREHKRLFEWSTPRSLPVSIHTDR